MSADNGIYILKTLAMEAEPEEPFEYRVAHASAIENIYWDHEAGRERNDGKFTPQLAFEYFGNAPTFRNLGKAMERAHEISEGIFPLEYGICVLDHGEQLFEHFSREEIEAFEERGDLLLEEHRRERDLYVKADLERRTMHLPSGTHVTLRSGFIEFPSPDWDGDDPKTQVMLRGRITGPITIEVCDVAEVVKDE